MIRTCNFYGIVRLIVNLICWPKQFEKHSKIISKPSPNHSQIIPESSQNHSNIIPKSSQNHPKSISEPSPNHSQIIRNTSTHSDPNHNYNSPIPHHPQQRGGLCEACRIILISLTTLNVFKLFKNAQKPF